MSSSAAFSIQKDDSTDGSTDAEVFFQFLHRTNSRELGREVRLWLRRAHQLIIKVGRGHFADTLSKAYSKGYRQGFTPCDEGAGTG